MKAPYTTPQANLLKLELRPLLLPPALSQAITRSDTKVTWTSQARDLTVIVMYLCRPLVSCQILPACSPKPPFHHVYGPGHRLFPSTAVTASSLLKFPGSRLKAEWIFLYKVYFSLIEFINAISFPESL